MSAKELPKGHIDFRIYFRKILKKVHPDQKITKEVKSELNAILFYVGKSIVLKAMRINTQKGGKTINSNSIQSAIQLCLPRNLFLKAASEGTRALELNASQKTSTGYYIPIGRVKRYFGSSKAKSQKFVTTNKFRHSKPALIYLAAVLEYLSEQILNIAGDIALKNRKIIIKLKDLRLAINSDESLQKVMNINEITILETDVKNAFQKSPFKYLVKRIGNDYIGDVRFSEEAVAVLQEYMESYLLNLLRISKMNAQHAKRITVQGKDFKLAISTKGLC
jgi:histone H2A